jgi:hypothetical protein
VVVPTGFGPVLEKIVTEKRSRNSSHISEVLLNTSFCRFLNRPAYTLSVTEITETGSVYSRVLAEETVKRKGEALKQLAKKAK